MVANSGVDAILHAVTFPLDDDRLSVVEKSVEDRRRQRAVVVEDGRPLLERLVRGQNQGTVFIALADDLEQQVGALFVDGQIAKFVHDQDVGLEIFLHFRDEAAALMCGAEIVDRVDCGGKQYTVTGEAGGVAQRNAQMAFSQSNTTDQDGVGPVFDELETEEVLNLRPVDLDRKSVV